MLKRNAHLRVPVHSHPRHNRLVQGTQTRPFSGQRVDDAQDINIIQYIGIAADEPQRIERHAKKKNLRMPLVEAGWTEAMCMDWCKENDLLAPTYVNGVNRDGCWFCHNQNLQSLRNLRHNYPDLWALLMKWDLDSPVSFHPDGHTVHDFDRRFAWEDAGGKPKHKAFRWTDVDDPTTLQHQMTMDEMLGKE